MLDYEEFVVKGRGNLDKPLEKGHLLDAIVYNWGNPGKDISLRRFPIDLSEGLFPVENLFKEAMRYARELSFIHGSKPVIAVRSLSKELYPHLKSANANV